jgi:hypothetical protein
LTSFILDTLNAFTARESIHLPSADEIPEAAVLNFYLRSKVSAHVSIFQLNELPIPPLEAKQKQMLSAAAGKLSKKPDDVKERAKLEVFVARELCCLSLDDWKHPTGTFTFGGDSESKADLDEIIRLSIAEWGQVARKPRGSVYGCIDLTDSKPARNRAC